MYTSDRHIYPLNRSTDPNYSLTSPLNMPTDPSNNIIYSLNRPTDPRNCFIYPLIRSNVTSYSHKNPFNRLLVLFTALYILQTGKLMLVTALYTH